MQIILAERYHWTPEQIGRLDEEYVIELLARIRAENDLAAPGRRQGSRKRAHREDSEEAEVD